MIHLTNTKSFIAKRAQMERERLRVRRAKGLPEELDDEAAWIQNLPPLSTPCAYDEKAMIHFQYMMKRVLDNVNVRPALATMLKQGVHHPNLPIKATEDICTHWDWSKVRVHLVASIAGRHESWANVILTVHPRLMKAILELGQRTGTGSNAKSLQLEYQDSSIGQYTTQWLNEFFWSCRGSRRKGGKADGWFGAEERISWEDPKFPRDLFHDSKSRAGPTLMHTKTILATFIGKSSSSSSFKATTSKPAAKRPPPKPSTSKATTQTRSSNGKQREILEISDDSVTESETESETEPESDEIQIIETAIGWAYMGLHNFTPLAWETLSGSASTFTNKGSSSSKAASFKPPAKRPMPKPSTSKPTTQTRSSNGKQREVLEISDDSVTESETESETEPESDDEIQIIETATGWAYVDSHNFTPSAWETLSGFAFCLVLNVSLLVLFVRSRD
ncbi:hypothetical protein V5O48_013998 [Marasmius crinis-equi]|uniref:Uncharacterized protein n=1 Tax=Marasmius crinis-equi TaxID=585013 RepID=A0ABR3EYK1_9AGAR